MQLYTMDWMMSTNYIYSQSWEDGENDLKTYKLDEKSVVGMITTGGDNVLNYLAHGVKHITSVDMNVHQNHLLELKCAVIKTQSRENALKILGQSNHALLMKEFDTISKELSGPAKEWWSTNTNKYKDFWASGVVGIFYLVMNFITRLFGLKSVFVELNAMKAENMEYQREIYWNNYDKIQNINSFVMSFTNLLAPFVGVPSRQLEMCKNPNLFSMVWHRLLYHSNWTNNYFVKPYTYSGQWDDTCIPLYLQEQYYDKVKSKLNEPDGLRIVTGRMDLINSDIKFNRYILLDHMDWMRDADILNEFANLKNNATDDCLFCWRSFSMKQPFAALRHLTYHTSTNIFDEITQAPIEYKDRVAMYNSIHVAELDGDLCKVTKPVYELSAVDSLSVFLNMMIQPFVGLGLNNRQFMNHYYEKQAKHYDAYRQHMLHGKEPLMYAVPWHQMKGKRVLLLAGGTGDLTDYFKAFIPEMDAVVISDISEPMINVANERIKTNGWTNVSARIEDILDDDDFNTEEAGTYDLVLLTYSLTMIPNWAKTIQTANKYLKTGGKLAITDFTVTEHQNAISRFFWKTMFSNTHIHLNQYHIHMLRTEMNEEYLRIEDGDFPYVPYLRCPFFYGIFAKK
jgi:S-adenosylmethionine-diacylgycerolhomoserine-N-methlytransferase